MIRMVIVVIGILLAVAVWMIVESILNRDKMSKTEFIITTGAGIIASSLIILSRLI